MFDLILRVFAAKKALTRNRRGLLVLCLFQGLPGGRILPRPATARRHKLLCRLCRSLRGIPETRPLVPHASHSLQLFPYREGVADNGDGGAGTTLCPRLFHVRSPSSRKDTPFPSPMMTWSKRRMPKSLAASRTTFVSLMSSPDGSRFPDG